ncbi:FRG domain-containing protein [Calothrix sp. FACHB-156]|nr:FRG domain-containing protein [Calothrix sp. FACHB-156]
MQSELQIIVRAQHCCASTSLLDWTEILYVCIAAIFAYIRQGQRVSNPIDNRTCLISNQIGNKVALSELG